MKYLRKRVILLVSILIIVFGVIFYTSTAYSQTNNLDKDKAEVVVKIKESSRDFRIKMNIVSSMGKMDDVKRISNKYGELRHVFLDENSFTIEVNREDIATLKKDYMVEEVRELRTIKAFLQDSVPLINATRIWSLLRNGINITGAGETICIIDTGVNFSHPDLVGKNATSCVIDCRGISCISNCSIRDDNGHGTHVAGIAAANGGIRGVALDVKILAVKVLNASGTGTEADLKSAIDFCVSNSSLYNISVISMSLGTDSLYTSYCDSDYSGTPNITKSVNDAIAKNISVIAATGNGAFGGAGNKTAIAAPACIRNVTAVTRSNKDDTANSNAHSNNITDLIAPGSSINSTSSNGAYTIMSGTSMSTPLVAGAFALLRQFKILDSGGRIMTPSEIEDVFKRTGKIIQDTNGVNFSRIDLYAAISLIMTPNAGIISPANGTRTKSMANFTCNATTENIALLTNITLLIYNQTGIFYSETKNISGVVNQTSFNYTFSIGADYLWGCRASDNRSYFSDSNNFTITYDLIPPLITIISPVNTTYRDGLFNVSLSEDGSWCGFSLDFAANVSMTRLNATYFNYTETNISGGDHNISFTCNDSAGNFNTTLLKLFSINKTGPNIILVAPIEGYSAIPGSIDFRYNVTHSRNITYCYLIVDGINISTNTSINTTSENVFSYSPGAGAHSWNVNCSDSLGNSGNGSSRSFILTYPSGNIGGSGSGGGGGTIGAVVYSLTQGEIGRGISKELEKDDRVKFVLYDNTKNTTYYINVTKITASSSSIIIYPDRQIFSFGIGDSKNIELTGDDYYDINLTLNDIRNNKANFTVRLIHVLFAAINETVPVLTDNQTDRKQNRSIGAFDGGGAEIKDASNVEDDSYLFPLIVMFIVLGFVLFLTWNKRRQRAQVIKK